MQKPDKCQYEDTVMTTCISCLSKYSYHYLSLPGGGTKIESKLRERFLNVYAVLPTLPIFICEYYFLSMLYLTN